VAGKRSIGSPEEKRRLIEESTVSMRPSEVFARRLVETRKSRGISQTRLAHRLTEDGIPLSSRAVRAIERGERGLSLDEALAIAYELQAVPAFMLTPPENTSSDKDGVYVKLSDALLIGGADMREWLRSGLPWRSSQEPPTSDARREAARDRFQRNLTRLAMALVDAHRSNTEGVARDVGNTIVAEVDRYRADEQASELSEPTR
jgi:transcriptional regulator with XRE-family HTH domain